MKKITIIYDKNKIALLSYYYYKERKKQNFALY